MMRKRGKRRVGGREEGMDGGWEIETQDSINIIRPSAITVLGGKPRPSTLSFPFLSFPQSAYTLVHLYVSLSLPF